MSEPSNPFDLTSGPLEHDPSVVFTLDCSLRLRSCNLAWDPFAAENGGEHLLRDVVVGRSILEFISGSLVDYYRAAYNHVLHAKLPWRLDYECSSATTRRCFAMHVHPLDGGAGLLVVNSLSVQIPHAPGAMADGRGYESPEGVVVMCSNCRRTRRHRSDRWDWVADYVSRPPERVSHGLCPPCIDHYHMAFAEGWPLA